MRVLFVTYCFGGEAVQTLIGVYKRGLRVALELHERGHDVLFDCAGRGGYRDDLTTLAEERIQFVDLGLHIVQDELEDERRERCLRAMSRCRPDLVVVGEAPLSGSLLEATLCAVELSVPVVVLDNAYNKRAGRHFLRDHGGMVDAVVLTGPDCAHARAPSARLRQIPPFVTSARSEAAELLDSLGLHAERLVCVLAYDRRVERLGFSLLERLPGAAPEFLFMSREPDECGLRAAALPPDLKARVRVLGLLPDPVLFGLIEQARLAVVKYGFMQVTECLALHTPVICVYHEGAQWLDLLPRVCQRFAQTAEHDDADPATVAAAERFLDVGGEAMRPIHAGGFDAAAQIAAFLEGLVGEPRREARTDAAPFRERQVRAAIRAAASRQSAGVLWFRSMRLRTLPREEVHSLVCRCTIDGADRSLRLWGHRYSSAWAARRGRQEVIRSGRRVLFASPRRHVLIEPDVGPALLPPL